MSSHKAVLITPKLEFSSDPSDLEIQTARVFREPLAPMTGAAVAGENAALAKALVSFKSTDDPENISALTSFIKEQPQSRWVPALQLNIGLLRKDTGYFSEAMQYFKAAYDGAKSEQGRNQQAIANRAIAIWMLMNAKVGRTSDLEAALADVSNRHFTGTDELYVTTTRECLSQLLHNPGKSYKCGPLALNNYINITKGSQGLNGVLRDFKSTSDGTSLAQIKQLADQLGVKVQMAKRSPGAEVIIPSILHYSLSHFACIAGKQDGKFRVIDPTFGENSRYTLSLPALEAGTDGYFIVPSGTLPKGWQAVGEEEASKVWGKGAPGARNDPEMTSCAPKKWCQQCNAWIPQPGTGGGCPAHGLAQAAMYTMQSTLNIVDTPLSYSGPYGVTYFQPNYNQLEANQPGTFSFSNIGQDWSINWVSYLTLDGSSNATVRVRGGGSELYNPDPVSGLYSPNPISQALLVKIGTNDFQRQLPDGSIETFNQPDGSGNVFMNKYQDGQGNIWTIAFDANYRVTTVTDPLSQQSTFSYLSNTVGNIGFYCISKIQDPFSRAVNFGWNTADTEITSITDAVGNISQFAYDSGSSFINTLTTPYGSTKFTAYTPLYPTSDYQIARGLRVGYPDGTCSQIENQYDTCFTFYWDREAMMQYPSDAATEARTKCEVTQFMFDDYTTFLENPIVYQYTPVLQLSGYGAGGTSNPYTYAYAGGSGNRLAQNLLGKPIQITTNLSYSSLTTTVTIGGTITAGNTVTTSISHGPPATYYNHTVTSTDTTSTIAAALSALMNADTSLNGIGFESTSVGPVIYMSASNAPLGSYYGGSVSGGATETIQLNSQQQQASIVNISGTVTVGDQLGLQINDNSVSGGAPTENYTAVTGDTLNSIAAAYASLINADSKLVANKYHAVAVGPNITITNNSASTVSYEGSGSASWVITDTIDTNDSVQTSQYQWNTLGYCTQKISPTLRTTSYTYASNNIDLLSAAETKGSDNALLGAWTYNSQHRPLTYIDGSGNTTQYTYTTTGELKTVTDPLGNVTTLNYNAQGYLTQIDGPMPGSDDVTNIGYDTAGRVANITDSEGYEIQYQYDSLDRLTLVTYPDGTTEQTVYDKLDAILHKDRIGRWTQDAYDVLDQLAFEIDPLGRKTQYLWCACGSLSSLTDPNNNVTTWQHDLEGRPTLKTYQDGTTVQYVYDFWTNRLRSKTDALGQRTTYVYDSDNEPLQTMYNNVVNAAAPVIYAWDPSFRRLSTVNKADWGMYTYSYNPYLTDSTTLPVANVFVGAVPRTGDIVNITVLNSHLSGGKHNVQYTVLSTDTSLTILATSLKTKINADSTLSAAGITATSSANIVSLQASGIGTVTAAPSTNGIVAETISGTITSGNTVSITVHDPALTGGSKTETYSVVSTDTTTTIATALKNAISGDSSLSAIGVTATSSGAVVSIKSLSANGTTYTQAVSVGATEAIAASGGPAETANTGGGGMLQNVANNVIPNSTIFYSYDGDGRTVQRAINGTSNQINWSYDQMSRITQEANVLGTFGYAYVDDTAGASKGTLRLSSIAYPNGQNTNFTWYPNIGDQRLQQISNLNPAGATLSQFNYRYDPAGEITQWGQIQNNGSLLYNLGYDAAGQLISANAGSGTAGLEYLSQYGYSYDPGANRTSALRNISQRISIGGTVTSGDVITLAVHDSGLSGGVHNVTYTTTASDTTTTIATKLAANITKTAVLETLGVNAASSTSTVTARSVSPNVTSYTSSVSGSATETVTIGATNNFVENATISGTLTSGDVLKIIVHDPALTGGSETVSYTVSSGTLTTVATGIKTAINGDSNLSSHGITATSASAIVTINSTSVNATTYSQSTNNGATESIALSVNPNVIETIGISGTKKTSDVLTFNFYDPALTGGTETVSYTVASADTLTTIATGIKTAINGDTNLQNLGLTATSSGAVVSVTSNSTNVTTYRASISSGSTEIITLGLPINGTQTAVVAGTVTSGNVLTIAVFDAGLTGGTQSVSYTV
ncbi:MAG TPA: cysteine peptidase family C39 domain-containing protein, partial [Planktothrix sp.]